MKKISLLFFCALAANSLFGQANVNYTNATFEVVKKINQGVSQTDLSEIKEVLISPKTFTPEKCRKAPKLQIKFIIYATTAIMMKLKWPMLLLHLAQLRLW